MHDCLQIIDKRLDRRASVHRDGDDWQILRQGELICPQMVLEPEALHAAEQDAGGDFPPAEQVQLGVGEEGPAVSLPLSEIGGQLQAVLAHS